MNGLTYFKLFLFLCEVVKELGNVKIMEDNLEDYVVILILMHVLRLRYMCYAFARGPFVRQQLASLAVDGGPLATAPHM